MRRHTQRQFLVTLAWIEHDMSRPSRSDHYLMQVAAEGRRALVEKPSLVKVEDFRIRFGSDEDRPEPSKVNHSKNMWLSCMTAPVDKVSAASRPGG